MKKHIHSDDHDFGIKVRDLLLYRKIISAVQTGDQTATLTLDNGTILDVHGNVGCGGCGNGWYFIDALNTCDNAITNVECVLDYDEYNGDVYHIYVFTDNRRINRLQVSGGDNGYYGTGYDLYITIKEDVT